MDSFSESSQLCVCTRMRITENVLQSQLKVFDVMSE